MAEVHLTTKMSLQERNQVFPLTDDLQQFYSTKDFQRIGVQYLKT